ncbi:uncharacterized protein TNCV_4429771 [Trichonephila clavipes]|nr:uncharacterized protein TNCV_4429771 [Trichonephila clavipes]
MDNGHLCYRRDITTDKTLLLLQRLFKKAYLLPFERDLRRKVSLNDSCLLGMGSNPGEDMDVCECIVPSWHGGTLNSRRAANPLVRLVEGKERWEIPDHSRVFSL